MTTLNIGDFSILKQRIFNVCIEQIDSLMNSNFRNNDSFYVSDEFCCHNFTTDELFRQGIDWLAESMNTRGIWKVQYTNSHTLYLKLNTKWLPFLISQPPILKYPSAHLALIFTKKFPKINTMNYKNINALTKM